jgi:hypothetical protein
VPVFGYLCKDDGVPTIALLAKVDDSNSVEFFVPTAGGCDQLGANTPAFLSSCGELNIVVQLGILTKIDGFDIPRYITDFVQFEGIRDQFGQTSGPAADRIADFFGSTPNYCELFLQDTTSQKEFRILLNRDIDDVAGLGNKELLSVRCMVNDRLLAGSPSTYCASSTTYASESTSIFTTLITAIGSPSPTSISTTPTSLSTAIQSRKISAMKPTVTIQLSNDQSGTSAAASIHADGMQHSIRALFTDSVVDIMDENGHPSIFATSSQLTSFTQGVSCIFTDGANEIGRLNSQATFLQFERAAQMLNGALLECSVDHS